MVTDYVQVKGMNLSNEIAVYLVLQRSFVGVTVRKYLNSKSAVI